MSLKIEVATRIAETVPMAIAVWDTDLKYVYCNLEWKKLYKIFDTVTGKCHLSLVPGVRADWLATYKKVLEHGEPIEVAEEKFIDIENKQVCIGYKIVRFSYRGNYYLLVYSWPSSKVPEPKLKKINAALLSSLLYLVINLIIHLIGNGEGKSLLEAIQMTLMSMGHG